MGNTKEKLIKNLESLKELVIERDNWQDQKSNLSKELALLKPKVHRFNGIFEFIGSNLILKIVYILISILTLILVLKIFHPLGYNVPMTLYVPISILVSIIAIFIYKKIGSILKTILSLVGILILLNIFKILPINYYLNSVIACLFGMFLSLIVCLPICLIWYLIDYIRYMATKDNVIAENKKIYEQRKDELTTLIEELEKNLDQNSKKREKITKKELHNDYQNQDAIERFIKYLETNRRDNLTDCINLYIEERSQELERQRLYELELEKKKILEKEAKEKQRERQEREQREKENNESFKAIAKSMNDVQKYIDEERRRRKY